MACTLRLDVKQNYIIMMTYVCTVRRANVYGLCVYTTFASLIIHYRDTHYHDVCCYYAWYSMRQCALYVLVDSNLIIIIIISLYKYRTRGLTQAAHKYPLMLPVIF